MLGGLKEGGVDALKLGTTAAGWVCFEEGVKRLGEDFESVSEIVAGAGTAGIFSLVCKYSFTLSNNIGRFRLERAHSSLL